VLTTLWWLLPVLVAFLCVSVRGAVGADELLKGKSLTLKDKPGKPQKRSLSLLSNDPSIGLGDGPGGADDPTLHGGSLRVLSIEGDVFDTTYSLPAAGWKAAKKKGTTTGYTFTQKGGPITAVTVKAGKTISAHGSGAVLGHTLGGNPDPVRVVLTLGSTFGGQQYCMSFGGTATPKFKAGTSYTATNAGAPGICPLPYGADHSLPYGDSAWVCRPEMSSNPCFDNLDSTVIEPDQSKVVEPHVVGSGTPAYDCFYVYPTVDLSTTVGNHLDVTDPTYDSLVLDPLLTQVARFNGQCRIFAPHYRQATFATFGTPEQTQDEAIAYADVLDAWRLYQKYDNGGRNVVIMGHSQGVFMLTQLLQDELDPSAATDLRKQLIVALLIGGNVTVPPGGVVGGSFQNLPLCQTADQTGCVIAYHSFAAGYPPVAGGFNDIGPGMDVACTNPAALGGGQAQFSKTYFPTHANQPLFEVLSDPGVSTPFVEFPQFYAGECVKDDTNHSYLRISANPGPGDQRQDLVQYTSPALSPALLGTHILDYSWPMGDLLDLVATKAATLTSP